MGKTKRRAEIAVGSSVCKKQTTAYDYEIKDLGRAHFLCNGLNPMNQMIGPYHIKKAPERVLSFLNLTMPA